MLPQRPARHARQQQQQQRRRQHVWRPQQPAGRQRCQQQRRRRKPLPAQLGIGAAQRHHAASGATKGAVLGYATNAAGMLRMCRRCRLRLRLVACMQTCCTHVVAAVPARHGSRSSSRPRSSCVRACRRQQQRFMGMPAPRRTHHACHAAAAPHNTPCCCCCCCCPAPMRTPPCRAPHSLLHPR